MTFMSFISCLIQICSIMWMFPKEIEEMAKDVADVVFAFTRNGVTRQSLEQTEAVRRIVGACRSEAFDAEVDVALIDRCRGTMLADSCRSNYRDHFQRA